MDALENLYNPTGMFVLGTLLSILCVIFLRRGFYYARLAKDYKHLACDLMGHAALTLSLPLLTFAFGVNIYDIFIMESIPLTVITAIALTLIFYIIVFAIITFISRKIYLVRIMNRIKKVLREHSESDNL